MARLSLALLLFLMMLVCAEAWPKIKSIKNTIKIKKGLLHPKIISLTKGFKPKALFSLPKVIKKVLALPKAVKTKKAFSLPEKISAFMKRIAIHKRDNLLKRLHVRSSIKHLVTGLAGHGKIERLFGGRGFRPFKAYLMRMGIKRRVSILELILNILQQICQLVGLCKPC